MVAREGGVVTVAVTAVMAGAVVVVDSPRW
jgi:hypothetical protein